MSEDRRRQAYIDAAKKLFLSKGYEATTIADILSEVDAEDASPSVFYHYFISKSDVYDVVLKDCANAYTLEMSERMPEQPSIEDCENEIVRMFEVMTRFFFACERMASENALYHSSFGADLTSYISQHNKLEVERLRAALPWRKTDRHDTVSEMIVGGVLGVARGLLERRHQRENGTVFDVALQVAEQALTLCDTPIERREAILSKLVTRCAQIREQTEALVAQSVWQAFDIERLMSFMSSLSFVADTVRIVDPVECRVLVINTDGTIEDGGICFNSWMRCESCDHCISTEALNEGCRREKLEVMEGTVYQVTAIPISIQTASGDTIACVVESVNASPEAKWLSRIDRCKPIGMLVRMNEKIYEDSLTRAYNRRFFDERLFCEAIDRQDVKLVSMLMCDLRDFKTINDVYGHAQGDRILTEVVAVMKRVIRATDMVIRVGGDEFLIVLPGCPEARAPVLAEKIGEEVAHLTCDGASGPSVGIDVGHAFTDDFTGDELQIARLCAEADTSMYAVKARAKRGGHSGR